MPSADCSVLGAVNTMKKELVELRVNGRTLSREVMPTCSYLSQSELPVTLGLGKANQAESIEIIWPSGTMQKLASPAIDRLIKIVEPQN